MSATGSPGSPHIQPPTSPSLAIPGTSLSIPSPLHFRLPIITRLSFNEQGQVTHHRDFWDVKDVIGLVPGVSLAQWIGTRLAAKGILYAARFWSKGKSRAAEHTSPSSETRDLESGVTPAAAYVTSTKNALGLQEI